jgi:hypothetical protein
MGFFQNDVFMKTHVKKFTHFARVDLQLRWNDSAKISKKTQTANLHLDLRAHGSIYFKTEKIFFRNIIQLQNPETVF